MPRTILGAMKTSRVCLLLLSFVLIAACGTKGDLVHPAPPEKTEPASAT